MAGLSKTKIMENSREASANKTGNKDNRARI